jgi:hypothetical protein
MLDDRLETLVIARLATSKQPLAADAIAKQLARFAPRTLDEPAFRARVTAVIERSVDASQLPSRIGKFTAKTWKQLVEHVLPAIGLGVSAADAKRLTGRDAWVAAIAARALGLWTDGSPPSLATVCDAYAWKQLALAGKPKRCPPEVRAVFLARTLGVEIAAPDRLLRLYAAAQLGAPRPELRALRDELVRNWLAGKQLGTQTFAADVQSIARTTRVGLLGDRKVFISSIWDELRRQPTWSALTLDEFKARLVRAHRDGDLELARADLVGALDPRLVSASETTADGTSFHFILR